MSLKTVSLKHDGTDGTVKMASLPVPSVSDRWDRLNTQMGRKRKEEEKSRDVTGDAARYVTRLCKYSKVNVVVSKYGCTDVQHVCMLLLGM